jgi:hypothetical protein
MKRNRAKGKKGEREGKKGEGWRVKGYRKRSAAMNLWFVVVESPNGIYSPAVSAAPVFAFMALLCPQLSVLKFLSSGRAA